MPGRTAAASPLERPQVGEGRVPGWRVTRAEPPPGRFRACPRHARAPTTRTAHRHHRARPRGPLTTLLGERVSGLGPRRGAAAWSLDLDGDLELGLGLFEEERWCQEEGREVREGGGECQERLEGFGRGRWSARMGRSRSGGLVRPVSDRPFSSRPSASRAPSRRPWQAWSPLGRRSTEPMSQPA